MLEGGRQLAYTHNKCGHVERGEGRDACVCGMFDGEIDRRGPAGDAAWTRMSEGESESELTDLTDSVGWLSLPPRHTILLPPPPESDR